MHSFFPAFSRYFLYTLALVCSLMASGCGCDEEDPTLVFNNNSDAAVSIHFESSSGRTVEIADLEGGATSREYVISPGMTKLAPVWGSIPVPYEHDLEVAYCYDYEVEFLGERVEISQIER